MGLAANVLLSYIMCYVISLGAFAGFQYLCNSADKKMSMTFEDVSNLFGPEFSPLFGYTDEELDVTLAGSGFRVRDDGLTIRVSGRIENHPTISGFLAAFPVLYYNADGAHAQITLSDRKGRIVRSNELTCSFLP